ncbi:sucrase ferredoxin [Actinophytocola sp.]|uniref:sucrase ferredoxin n=1 Tax=Actinophytocola sp. TaxID=1872138 RepID=UPI002ED5A320
MSAPATGALPGCAVVARLLGGNPSGTAAFMRSWLLIEQPGPWSTNVLEETLDSALPQESRATLEEMRKRGLRPLLIRRPGKHTRDPQRTRRTVFVGGGDPGSRWLERLEINDLSELATLDLSAVVEGRGGLGEPVDGPLFLICTHGTKDMCCAVLGRPLASSLDANYPGRTWEVSHVGGDRWAGNLLVVPDGFLHGQLEPNEAARVAKAALNDQVEPDHLRGRTSVGSSWSQHAEIAVRQGVSGVRGLDDVLAVDERPLLDDPGSDTWMVRVRAAEQLFEVTVRHRTPARSRSSRCSSMVAPSGYVTERIRPI